MAVSKCIGKKIKQVIKSKNMEKKIKEWNDSIDDFNSILCKIQEVIPDLPPSVIMMILDNIIKKNNLTKKDLLKAANIFLTEFKNKECILHIKSKPNIEEKPDLITKPLIKKNLPLFKKDKLN
jgi:hypothetical protein